MDILIGLGLLALILLGVYVVTHHKPPATVAGADLANTVSAAVAGSWEALQRDLPEIVSAELAQAKADLSAALARAQAAEQALLVAKAAHDATLASVAARVAAAVTGDPALPPSSLAPVVEAADAARVSAFADQINPPQVAA